jgi:hypothetical protein
MENSFSHNKRKGRPKKRKGDVTRISSVINTPPILGENAPSSSRQGTHVVRPLDFVILFCTTLFLGFFEATC